MAGWTTAQLIELADKRTERRGTKTLDLNSEFVMALQDFCIETRWEWRRKFVFFTIQQGVWQYDLTALSPTPITDMQQMVKHGVKYYPNPGAPRNWAEITPMFEKEQQMAAIYTNINFAQPAPPQQYFRMPNVAMTMALAPVPDRDYPGSLDYWSMPILDPTALPTDIPLVPPSLHFLLLKKLEIEIFRYTIGEGDIKFKAAIARYEELLNNAQLYDAMVPGEHKNFSSDEDYDNSWSTGHSAIQSTT